jgi:hypothetical protein
MAQVEAAVVLSVVVRWGPVKPAVNGTVVARLARVKLIQSWRRRYQLGRWVRPVQDDTCLVGKTAEQARQEAVDRLIL